ncbi:MAG: hypothetical protein LBR10_03340 [Prevotellaceae bacterium]|jgi:hypothetical protein|nr:hypothetical protein [Prevotellaceae bacterium]
MELSKKQIERQDFVDNSIFELLQSLHPAASQLDWNIDIIGEIRDVIQSYFIENIDDIDEQIFYPFIEE